MSIYQIDMEGKQKIEIEIFNRNGFLPQIQANRPSILFHVTFLAMTLYSRS